MTLDHLDQTREYIIESVFGGLYEKIEYMITHDDDGFVGSRCFQCTSMKLGALIRGTMNISSPKPVKPFHGLSYNALMDQVLSMDGIKARHRKPGHEGCGYLKDSLDQVVSKSQERLKQPIIPDIAESF